MIYFPFRHRLILWIYVGFKFIITEVVIDRTSNTVWLSARYCKCCTVNFYWHCQKVVGIYWYGRVRDYFHQFLCCLEVVLRNTMGYLWNLFCLTLLWPRQQCSASQVQMFFWHFNFMYKAFLILFCIALFLRNCFSSFQKRQGK